MPEEIARPTRRIAVLAACLSLMPALVACRGVGLAEDITSAITPAAGFAAPAPPRFPNTAEAAYLDGTARAVFRRRPAERTSGFVETSADGFSVCSRSPGDDGYDYALIILQRRIFSDAVSQVEDDAIILRGADDTAVCRTGVSESDWVRSG